MVFLIIMVLVIGLTSITGYALTKGKAYLLYSLDSSKIFNKNKDKNSNLISIDEDDNKEDVELITKLNNEEEIKEEPIKPSTSDFDSLFNSSNDTDDFDEQSFEEKIDIDKTTPVLETSSDVFSETFSSSFTDSIFSEPDDELEITEEIINQSLGRIKQSA